MLYEMMGEMKKGPWKAEEDEVLINHVKKYGPKDWSSIRSKGLLRRTGKSCRLRWVNKLRPDLKNGVKFSAEEERTVIELQAEFGNKWARIATYLPGRTDNDVKNFWSSRQKRLARILQTPQAPKSHKTDREGPVIHDVPTVKASKLSSLTKEETSPINLFCSPSFTVHNLKPISAVPFPEPELNSNMCYFEQNLLQPELDIMETKSWQDHRQQIPLSFQAKHPQLQTEVPLASESQELIPQLGEPNFFEVFENGSDSGGNNPHLQYVSSYGTEGSCGNDGWKENDNPVTPDSFIHDFPIDMFDHLDMLPSPPEW
ncbi:transcription factor DUO1 [Daucus carota subsp. sativus]|nr:PREDICTED: transcription factor MYB32 [Daucus carota subsp. sativus]